MDITDRLAKIEKEIAVINRNKFNNRKKITIIAVSKNSSLDDIKKLHFNGHQEFGENRVQEVVKKNNQLEMLSQNIRWHFIGHLQINKVSKIIPVIDVLHSLDSIRLLEAIENYYLKKNTTNNNDTANRLKCFIQVNISGENQKNGIAIDDLNSFFIRCQNSPVIEINGLMTIAPLSSKAEDSRKIFQKLKDLANKFNLKELSMGMTNDYKIAIEEGATFLRIGRLIFNKDYQEKK
jgi:pyridoxal phosphate enzyme (YggS family)